MLRNRPWCNIKAQQENPLLKRQLWDWLECAVIDKRWVCFKRDTQAFAARLRFQISQRKRFETCRDSRKYCSFCTFRRRLNSFLQISPTKRKLRNSAYRSKQSDYNQPRSTSTTSAHGPVHRLLFGWKCCQRKNPGLSCSSRKRTRLLRAQSNYFQDPRLGCCAIFENIE